MISDSPENFDDFEKVNFDNNDLSFLTLGAMPENMMFQMNSPGSPLNWSSPMKSVSIPYALVIPAISQLKNRQDQHLLQHYASVVSKSLCIASTDEDNPFLKLMMPLASNSSAVMGALLALSAVHLKYNGGYPETVNRKSILSVHSFTFGHVWGVFCSQTCNCIHSRRVLLPRCTENNLKRSNS